MNVNFGNRYRIGGSEKEEADLPDVEKSFVLEDFMEQASSMESSHRSESNGNGREDCTSMDDQSESSTALISVLRETANLYCDSPFPTSLGSSMMEADFFVDPICNDKLPTIGGFSHQETAASSSSSSSAKYEIPFIQRPPTRRVSKRKQQELSPDSSALPSHDYKDIHSNDSPRQDESEDLSFMTIEENQRKRSHNNIAADTDIDTDPFKEGEALNDCQLEYLEVEMEGDDDDDEDDEDESESNSFQNATTVATTQELPPILLPDSSTSLSKPKPLHEVDRKVDLTPIACGIASSIPQSLPLPSSSSSSIVHATSSVVSTPLLSPSPLDSREEKLPPGWVKCISKREGRAYWFNSQTGQSSWALPR